MTLKDKIAKARELREKATQGPFDIYRRETEYGGFTFHVENESMVAVSSSLVDLDNPKAKADSELICFSLNNILDLCDALEKCLEFIVKLQKYECDSTYSHDCNGCRLHEKSFDFLNDLEPSEELTKEQE